MGVPKRQFFSRDISIFVALNLLLIGYWFVVFNNLKFLFLKFIN